MFSGVFFLFVIGILFVLISKGFSSGSRGRTDDSFMHQQMLDQQMFHQQMMNSQMRNDQILDQSNFGSDLHHSHHIFADSPLIDSGFSNDSSGFGGDSGFSGDTGFSSDSGGSFGGDTGGSF